MLGERDLIWVWNRLYSCNTLSLSQRKIQLCSYLSISRETQEGLHMLGTVCVCRVHAYISYNAHLVIILAMQSFVEVTRYLIQLTRSPGSL